MKAKKILLSLLTFGMLFTLPMANEVNANEVDEDDNIEEIVNAEKQQEVTIENGDVEQDNTTEVNEQVEVNTREEVKQNEEPVAKQRNLVQATAETNELVADQTTLAEAFPDMNFRTYVAVNILGNSVYDDSIDKLNTLSATDVSTIQSTAQISIVNNKLISSAKGIEYFKNLKKLSVDGTSITSLDLSNLDYLQALTCYQTPMNELILSEASKTTLTTLNYRHTNIDSLDLTGFDLLRGSFGATKVSNVKLSRVTGIYISGSRNADSLSMVRVTATAGGFSWDSATGYYTIGAGFNGNYGFAVADPKYPNKWLNINGVGSIVDGALMDAEGNLIIGGSIQSDGSVLLEEGGTIASHNGTYIFDGKTTISTGTIVTEEQYTFEKNVLEYDESTGSYSANIGEVATSVVLPDNSTASIDTITGSANVPKGSIITNDDGDKIHTTGPSVLDENGNVASDDYTVTVPVDKVGDIKPDENGNTILPDGSVIKDKDGNTVNYPGEISVGSDGTIDLLPLENITKDELDEIQKELDKLVEGELKDKLQDQIDEVQEQFDLSEQEESAKNAVDTIIDENGTMKDGVTQEDINNTQKEVDKLPEGDLKDQLQTLIDKAQEQLDKKIQEEKAQDSVQILFDVNGSIKDDVTQTDITIAQKEVDKLSSGELKDKLQTQINEAQKQFDEREFTVLETFEVFTGSGSVSARINAPVEKFSKVYVNRVELATSNYEVSEGSTIITLNESYLRTLVNGTYNVEVEFSSGAKIIVPLTVNASSNPSKEPEEPNVEEPKRNPSITGASTTTVGEVNTGDTTDLKTLFTMVGISLLGMLLVVKRRKQEN